MYACVCLLIKKNIASRTFSFWLAANILTWRGRMYIAALFARKRNSGKLYIKSRILSKLYQMTQFYISYK